VTVGEWAGAIRVQSEAVAARCRELLDLSSEMKMPADYADLVARIRLLLTELEAVSDRIGHDARNLQQVVYADDLH